MKNESENGEQTGFLSKLRAKLRLKKDEKTPRGHNLLVKINATRSKRARTMDGRQTARHLFRKPTDENIEKWAEQPGRRDFLRIDSKGRHAGSKQKEKTSVSERKTRQSNDTLGPGEKGRWKHALWKAENELEQRQLEYKHRIMEKEAGRNQLSESEWAGLAKEIEDARKTLASLQQGPRASSEGVRVNAPEPPRQLTRTEMIKTALVTEAGEISPDPRYHYDPSEAKFNVDEGRYSWDKIKPRFIPESDLERVKTVRELRAYQAQIGQVQTYQKERMERINARAEAGNLSLADRMERRRLRDLDLKTKRAINRAGYLAGQINSYKPLTGTPDAIHADKRNVTLNSENLRALESLQASPREFGAMVDNLTTPARRQPGRLQQRQGIVAAPLDPGYTYYPWQGSQYQAGDLLVHTHPNRMGKLNTVYPRIHVPKSILPDHPAEFRQGTKRVPTPLWEWNPKLTRADIEKADERVGRAEKKHARTLAEFADLIETVKSVQYDDSPSGGDILDATSSLRPRMIVTPRTNILLVPGRETKPLGSQDWKERRTISSKMSDIIDRADAFAFDRTNARFPKSLKDAQQSVAEYQRTRQTAISAALEREAKLQVHFYDKGETIKFPGEIASTPKRPGKKTRAQKKAEKRGEKPKPEPEKKEPDKQEPEKPEIDPNDWDPF